MNDDDIDWSLIREQAKQSHDERVAKTPERIEYAINRFKQEGLQYSLKSKSNGHFHVFDSAGNLFQFWASTGKIYFDKKTKDARGFTEFYDNYRGIENCIKIVKHFVGKKQSEIEKLKNYVKDTLLFDENGEVANDKLLEFITKIEKQK